MRGIPSVPDTRGALVRRAASGRTGAGAASTAIVPRVTRRPLITHDRRVRTPRSPLRLGGAFSLASLGQASKPPKVPPSVPARGSKEELALWHAGYAAAIAALPQVNGGDQAVERLVNQRCAEAFTECLNATFRRGFLLIPLMFGFYALAAATAWASIAYSVGEKWLSLVLVALLVSVAALDATCRALRPIPSRDLVVFVFAHLVAQAAAGKDVEFLHPKKMVGPGAFLTNWFLAAVRGLPQLPAYSESSDRVAPRDDADAPDPLDRTQPWRIQPRARREFASDLYWAGWRIEVEFAAACRRLPTPVRDDVRLFAQRIRAGLLEHATACTAKAGPANDDRLTASLAAGLRAACNDQWDQLAYAEPAPLRQRIWAGIARRVGLAGLLTGIALVVVPLLVPGGQADALRNVLLSAAALAMVTPQKALDEAGGGLRKVLFAGR